jgi:phosphohistidine swiveling domain-containing protein/DNA-binding transcriptional ArsR family regulator
MGGLFYSPTTQKILAILCEKPEASFHVNELIRLTGKYPNSVTYALKGLEKTGLVTFRREGRRKLYQINTANPIYPEVKNIFAKLGTFIDEKLIPLERRAEINWVKILNRPSTVPLATAVHAAFRDWLPRIIGVSFRYAWQNGVTGGIYYVQDELKAVNQALKVKVEKNPAWAMTVIKKFQQSCEKLVAEAKKNSGGRLYQLSNKELAKRLNKFYSAYLEQMAFMSLPGNIENWLLEEIKQEARKALEKMKRTKDFNRFVEILTAPTLLIEEQLGALEIAEHVKRNGLDKKASRMIMGHAQKWAHVPLYNFSDPPFSYDHFEEEIETLVERFPNPQGEIKRVRHTEEERLKRAQKAMKELGFSKAARQKVKLFQDITYLRSERWNSIYKSHLLHLPLIDEVARRLGLERQDLSLLSYEEIIGFLTSDKRPTKILLSRRKRGWAVLTWEGETRIVSGVREIVETMERFRIVDQSRETLKPEEGLPTSLDETYQLRGIPVYKGKLTAPVKVVLDREDFSKVKEGDIIVAYQTIPQYLSCLYRASGLIIDEANPTAHAVLYAKALKLPTIIGTRFGTRFLKDNDKVLLDATKGVAKKVNNPGSEALGLLNKVAYIKN